METQATTTEMTVGSVISFIHQLGADDVSLLFDTLNSRSRQLREIADSVARATIKVGDRVRIADIRPKYLAGTTGTVTSISDGKFTVTFDDTASYDVRTRFGPFVNVPAGCLKVLS